MGTVEVDDQVAGVEYLVKQGLCDRTRVGMYGWSYGGYMSAMCLARRPDIFHVAVSGAPVTHWDGYDTHYTERYMSTPQLNPEGYGQSINLSCMLALSGFCKAGFYGVYHFLHLRTRTSPEISARAHSRLLTLSNTCISISLYTLTKV